MKRYRLYRYEGAPAEMEVEAEGEWVRYEDVASAPELKAEVERLREALAVAHNTMADCTECNPVSDLDDFTVGIRACDCPDCAALARKDGPA